MPTPATNDRRPTDAALRALQDIHAANEDAMRAYVSAARRCSPNSLTCLGTFWMHRGDGLWPGVAYQHEDGDVRMLVGDQSNPPKWRAVPLRGPVQYSQWAGRRDGTPGLINGDRPQDAPSPLAAAQPESPSGTEPPGG